MTENEKKILNLFLEDIGCHPEFENVGLSSIGKVSVSGNNLLHFAAIKNRADICEILVGLGLDINQRGEHGYTPLHEAAEQGNEKSFVTLLNLGADVHIRNKNGITPAELREMMKEE